MAGAITLYDFSTATTSTNGYIWSILGGWSIFAALTQLLWFHEFFRGGPEQTDNVYGSFNKVAFRVYLINFVMLGAGFGLDSSNHPVSLATNGVTLIFGFLISYLVKQNIEVYQRD